MDVEKQCPRCQVTKPASEYYKAAARKGGLSYECKVCHNIQLDEWRRNNPDKVRAVRQRATKKWQAANRDKMRCAHLRRTYNMTLDDYKHMLADQNGCCAICGSSSPNNGDVTVFAVDHDHATGNVRGLLCNPCNRGIGYLQDDVDVVAAATDYLRRNR